VDGNVPVLMDSEKEVQGVQTVIATPRA